MCLRHVVFWNWVDQRMVRENWLYSNLYRFIYPYSILIWGICTSLVFVSKVDHSSIEQLGFGGGEMYEPWWFGDHPSWCVWRKVSGNRSWPWTFHDFFLRNVPASKRPRGQIWYPRGERTDVVHWSRIIRESLWLDLSMDYAMSPEILWNSLFSLKPLKALKHVKRLEKGISIWRFPEIGVPPNHQF